MYIIPIHKFLSSAYVHTGIASADNHVHSMHLYMKDSNGRHQIQVTLPIPSFLYITMCKVPLVYVRLHVFCWFKLYYICSNARIKTYFIYILNFFFSKGAKLTVQ